MESVLRVDRKLLLTLLRCATEVKVTGFSRSNSWFDSSEHRSNLFAFLSAVKGICVFALLTRLLGIDRYLFAGLFSHQYIDKIGHILFFGLLSAAFHHVATRRTSWEPATVIGVSLFLVLLLAVGDEFSQIWFEGRKFEHLDLLANFVGASVMGPFGCLSSLADLRLSDSKSSRRLFGSSGWGSYWQQWVSLIGEGSQDSARMGVAALCPIRILLVEDSPQFVSRLRWIVEELNHSLVSSRLSLVVETNLSGASQRLEESSFDLVLVDLCLPDARGIRVHDRIVQEAGSSSVVVLTGETYWESVSHLDSGRLINAHPKEDLNPEILFWLLYDAVGSRASMAASPLGFSGSFGRIHVGSFEQGKRVLEGR